MSTPRGIPSCGTHRRLNGNKNKKNHMGFYLFICLFYFVSARDRKLFTEKLLLRTSRDPWEAFRSWHLEMCIFLYLFFLKGRRAKWCVCLHYAQLFHTFRTKRRPWLPGREDTLTMGCLLQFSKTPTWPETFRPLVMSRTPPTCWAMHPQWSRGHPYPLPGVDPEWDPPHVGSFDAYVTASNPCNCSFET